MRDLFESLSPRDINTVQPYEGFKNTELGDNLMKVVMNIVFIQGRINPYVWTPFSFEDYIEHCTHKVNHQIERNLLDILIFGGVRLQPGYLAKKGDLYCITEKFLDLVRAFRYQY
jgi:hypothetical protein